MGEKGLGLTRYPFNKLVKIVLAHNHTLNSDRPGIVKSVIEEKHYLYPDRISAGTLSSTFKNIDGEVLLRFIFNRYSYRKEFDYSIPELPEGDIAIGSLLLRLYNESKLEVVGKLTRSGR